MHIELLQNDTKPWDDYVTNTPAASVYHLTAWRQVIEKTFHHRSYYFMAREGGEVVGVLPLVLIRSLLFGRYLVSLPCFNYGGISASNPAVGRALLEQAIEVGRHEGATHIELRHQESSTVDLPCKTGKVAMVLELPSSSDALWEGFRAKLRSQVKRAERERMAVKIGGLELLDGFYAVFARNMRDLGTPVYSKSFFRTILKTFPAQARIVSVYHQERPVASGFLIGFNDRMEIPWASSLREFNSLGTNMLLYWQALKFAVDTGHRQFDFGRSSVDSPTFKFKQQWGAGPRQLYWHYWTPDEKPLPDISPRNPKYRLFIAAWKRMPLALTLILGPRIVHGIP
ncbi:MAG TPA: FemAB family XrtA/PEP-CTERM system-associated protein [Candidatus Acidoferrum sp.]|nr:FemAB family XrtA/PEP-CTERM system-associated protein [Candidatus Acidoferrum sp.]